MAKLITSYAFNEEKQAYVGIVAKKSIFNITVLTVGMMKTEAGIKLWLATVLRNRSWETASEPADMHDNP